MQLETVELVQPEPGQPGVFVATEHMDRFTKGVEYLGTHDGEELQIFADDAGFQRDLSPNMAGRFTPLLVTEEELRDFMDLEHEAANEDHPFKQN
jgi:hypothetical protein